MKDETNSQESLKNTAEFIGYHGVRNHFLDIFPKGFEDKGYLRREWYFKARMKAVLDATVPVEKALDGIGFGEDIFRIFEKSQNLVDWHDVDKLQTVISNKKGDQFIRGAAAFTLADTSALRASALEDMADSLRKHKAISWPIFTYLPFLWRPENHMFLKPEAVKRFSRQVGHEFDQLYRQPKSMDIEVYERLLNLKAQTASEIQDLKPCDGIDVQSFIWVTGKKEYPKKEPA